MSKERDDHNCRENMMLDGDCQIVHLVFDGDEVFFPGQCSICNRRLTEKYKYVDTREAETDEIIEKKRGKDEDNKKIFKRTKNIYRGEGVA